MEMANATTGLSTDWLAARMGVQPARVEALRRAGELLGVRRADGKHVFPSWQFGTNGRPLPLVARLVRAARAAGIDDEALHELVGRRIASIGRDGLVRALADEPADQVMRRLVWRPA
jgi:hypothetical protein